jgi:hypothetical protein
MIHIRLNASDSFGSTCHLYNPLLKKVEQNICFTFSTFSTFRKSGAKHFLYFFLLFPLLEKVEQNISFTFS